MDTERKHYLKFVYLLFHVTPRALERYVNRKYPGGIYRALHENREKLKEVITRRLTTECWKELENFIEEDYGPFGSFTDDIVNNTVLDKDVLDGLISKLLLTIDDSEIVERCASQSDRNRAVLDLLARRGCDIGVLIKALQDSNQAQDLVHRMIEHSKSLKNADSAKPKGNGETKLRLQKSYRIIIESLATTETLVDRLIEREVLSIEDSEEIRSSTTRSEKNRKLIKKVMTRDENACQVFVQILEDDDVDKKLAETIKNVKIAKEERKLISKGIKLGLRGKRRLLPVLTMVSVMNFTNGQEYPTERPEPRVRTYENRLHKSTYTDNLLHVQIDRPVARGTISGNVEERNKGGKQDTTLNLNIAMNKLKNLYQLVFEISEAMTEDELSECQNTIAEILLSLGEEPADWFQTFSDCEQLEEALHFEYERRKITREMREKDERQNRLPYLSEDIVKEWRKDDRMLVKTKARENVLKLLDDHSVLVVTGPPGCGKTFTTRDVSLLYQCKGFCIIPITDPKHIQFHYRKDNPTVFVVDDMFGNLIASQQEVENWEQFFCSPFYKTVQNDCCFKIISSCRLQVYRDDCVGKIRRYISCECNFGSAENRLDTEEKKRFMEMYIDEHAFSELPASTEDDFFVLLCTLFKKEHGMTVTVREFFERPIAFYKKCIDQLYDHGQGGRYKICCLALVVLYNNMLNKNMFERKATEKERQIYRDLSESLGLDGEVRRVKLRESFDSLIGTFLTYENGIYRTVHDKIFDIIAHILGTKIFDCIIDYGESKLIHERCVRPNNENTDLMVIIPDEFFDLYVERCVNDWKSGKVRMVFSNNNF